MQVNPRILLLAVALLAATAASAQTVYKSTNPDGSIVYSDKPPVDGKVDKVIEFPDLPSSPVPDTPPAPANRGSIGTQRRAGSPRPSPAQSPEQNTLLRLYSATWCGYCRRARAYLAQHAIDYENFDIDTPEGRDEFERAGKGGIPLLVGRGRKLRGFKVEGYDAFFAR